MVDSFSQESPPAAALLAMTRLHPAVLVFWAAGGISAFELTADQWRADLAFLAKQLPQRPKNLYHMLPKPEFAERDGR
jgi:hypothetical protein